MFSVSLDQKENLFHCIILVCLVDWLYLICLVDWIQTKMYFCWFGSIPSVNPPQIHHHSPFSLYRSLHFISDHKISNLQSRSQSIYKRGEQLSPKFNLTLAFCTFVNQTVWANSAAFAETHFHSHLPPPSHPTSPNIAISKPSLSVR